QADSTYPGIPCRKISNDIPGAIRATVVYENHLEGHVKGPGNWQKPSDEIRQDLRAVVSWDYNGNARRKNRCRIAVLVDQINSTNHKKFPLDNCKQLSAMTIYLPLTRLSELSLQ